MKKIFAALAVSTLLFGCSFGSGPADPASGGKTGGEDIPVDIALTDDLFITLSAQILCLPSNSPEASKAEIEQLARQVLADAGVAEDDFDIYQRTIEADPPSKQELSLAIIGKMSEFCTIETVSSDTAGATAEDFIEDEAESTSDEAENPATEVDSAAEDSAE